MWLEKKKMYKKAQWPVLKIKTDLHVWGLIPVHNSMLLPKCPSLNIIITTLSVQREKTWLLKAGSEYICYR